MLFYIVSWKYANKVIREHSQGRANVTQVAKYGTLEDVLTVFLATIILPMKMALATNRSKKPRKSFLNELTRLGLATTWLVHCARFRGLKPQVVVKESYANALQLTAKAFGFASDPAIGLQIAKAKLKDFIMGSLEGTRMSDFIKPTKIDKRYRISLPPFARLLGWKQGDVVITIPNAWHRQLGLMFVKLEKEQELDAGEPLDMLKEFVRVLPRRVTGEDIKRMLDENATLPDAVQLFPEIFQYFPLLIH